MMVLRLIVLVTALLLGRSAWAQDDGDRLDISDAARCWMMDPTSPEGKVTVTVGFSLDLHGKVLGDVRQISATGGDEEALKTAFLAARRAVLRCGSTGYNLPADMNSQTSEIEITFEPPSAQTR